MAVSLSEETPISESFTFSQESIQPLYSRLPPETSTLVQANPERFLDLMEKLFEQDEITLRLIDKEHALPDLYHPPDLVSLDSYPELTLTRQGLKLREILIDDLLEMVGAAKESGVTLPISSTYRSFEYQETVYTRIVAQLGEESANRESAKPGHSQHQTGLSIDFGTITNEFAESDAGNWVRENAGRFGFSLSYPPNYEKETGYRWESWHYRYVGRVGTQVQKEYFGDIQQFFLEFWEKNRDWLRSYRYL